MTICLALIQIFVKNPGVAAFFHRVCLNLKSRQESYFFFLRVQKNTPDFASGHKKPLVCADVVEGEEEVFFGLRN